MKCVDHMLKPTSERENSPLIISEIDIWNWDQLCLVQLPCQLQLPPSLSFTSTT